MLPDFGGQTIDMMGIVRIIVDDGATFWSGWKRTSDQKDDGQ